MMIMARELWAPMEAKATKAAGMIIMMTDMVKDMVSREITMAREITMVSEKARDMMIMATERGSTLMMDMVRAMAVERGSTTTMVTEKVSESLAAKETTKMIMGVAAKVVKVVLKVAVVSEVKEEA